MLKNNKLLIDKDCPMCRLYGAGFSRLNLVDDQTVVNYQTADNKVFKAIDKERAKSEIALHDTVSGNTVYGAAAFMKILGHNNRLLRGLFSLKIVRFLGTKFYRFISFNRHVITGAAESNGGRKCVPPMHKTYRWIYILLTAFFTGFMVNQFAMLLDAKMGVAHYAWREYLICFGHIIWQFIALGMINKKKRLDYLGNMSTVSFIGGVLLVPLLLVNVFTPLSLLSLIIGFMAIVGIMFLMHVRRCKRLGLPLITSFSWVAFRSIVLILVLILLEL